MKPTNENLDKLTEGVTVEGKTFYTFKNQEEIPQVRLEAYLSRNHEFDERGIKNQDLLLFCDLVEKYGNEGQFMAVQQLNGYLKTLLQKPVTLFPAIYLASPLIILGDEPLDEVTAEYDQEKLKLATFYPEVESFFLTLLVDLKPSLEISSSSGGLAVYTSQREKMIELIFQEEITGQKTMR